jgi:hypothetical protein
MYQRKHQTASLSLIIITKVSRVTGRGRVAFKWPPFTLFFLDYVRQGLCKAWHMPMSGKLSVDIWKLRFREKWNMVKIENPQFTQCATKKIGPVDAGIRSSDTINLKNVCWQLQFMKYVGHRIA